ncbi:Mannose-1-phosphate guanylyltransferase / Mannose-6-phosphate isomerase, partial [hydrothermal vent metagenome]
MIIQPVILAGGTGSRLWPMSRELYPKQLLNLVGEDSLLQATIKRAVSLNDTAPPLLVVGEEHRFIVKSQLAEIAMTAGAIILEPCGRNTAPAIYAAALYCQRLCAEPVIMLVLPADHLIKNQTAFAAAVSEAASLAREGRLVTFGIQPDKAETGYGYIEKGKGNEVLSFVEKPDMATAEKYLAAG